MSIKAAENRWVRWAQVIVDYYRHSRGAGTTYHQAHGWLAPMAGTELKKHILFTSLRAGDKDLTAGCIAHSLGSDPDSLYGHRGPLIVEHDALMHILLGLLAEIESMRKGAARK